MVLSCGCRRCWPQFKTMVRHMWLHSINFILSNYY